jgi:hypothetical protein
MMDVDLGGLALSEAQNRLEKILIEASPRENGIEVRGTNCRESKLITDVGYPATWHYLPVSWENVEIRNRAMSRIITW